MVKDLKGFVERTPFQHKSVTILVGGNDLSNGKTVSECCLEYESLVQCIRRNNPNAHINLVEIPPRINQKTVTNKIYDMNQWIHDWANKEENADCTFIRNGLNENPYFYQQDQVHLSRNRGGGCRVWQCPWGAASWPVNKDKDTAQNIPTAHHVPEVPPGGTVPGKIRGEAKTDFKGEVVTMWDNGEEHPIRTNTDGDRENKTLKVSLGTLCINC